MSFLSGVRDWFGIDPDAPWTENLGSVLTSGIYRADGSDPDISHLFLPGGFITAGLNAMNSPSSVSEASSVLNDVLGQDGSSYLGDLFETSEHAAEQQAVRNEAAAIDAWKRSEQAADNALRRARELRQTAYQDAVSSLKAAGLNPVLAAGGGISGSAVTAPQANAPSSSSGMADGLNAADLLMSIAAILSGAGSLIGNINPRRIISQTTSTSTSENTSWIYHMNGRK